MILVEESWALMMSGIRCQVPHKKRPWLTGAAVVVLLIGAAHFASALTGILHAAPPKDSKASTKEPSLQKDVLPIFQRHCLRCHAMRVKKGGLDLSTSEGVFAGGESGRVVVPNQ